MNALTNNRIERRTQRQRKVMAKTEIGKYRCDNGVDTPGMQAPMEKCDLQCFTGRGDIAPFGIGWVEKVDHGLGNPKEHQADTHAGCKKHGKP